jgi:hypothetical protein
VGQRVCSCSQQQDARKGILPYFLTGVPQIDELAKPSSCDANETITHDMFRISNIPTKDMFFRELQLGSKEEFPFLHLVVPFAVSFLMFYIHFRE